MKIVFFCPSPTVINGGIKHIFRMAECLIAAGHDAVVFEQNRQRPQWFSSTAPIVGQEIITDHANRFYVLPEDQPHILRDFAPLPAPKAIYSQNHFYGALGIADAASYADYNVTALLCSSQTITNHCRLRHPTVPAFIVPCAVDTNLFKSDTVKNKIIAYMPRKRPIEAVFLRDMFRFTFPQYRDWQWREISNVNETQTAALMRDASVFLSLSRLEGFGLTPLEAMASGCIVAGFTGIGGRDYANPQNGFWVDEDDHAACVTALGQAVALHTNHGTERAGYGQACAQTLAAYTPETFAEAVKQIWNHLLSSHFPA